MILVAMPHMWRPFDDGVTLSFCENELYVYFALAK